MNDIEMLKAMQDSLAQLADMCYRLEVLAGKELKVRESVPKVCPHITNDGYCGVGHYRERKCNHKGNYLECQDFSLWFWSKRAESMHTTL